MSFDDVRLLAAIGEHGTFTLAAKRVGIPPSTLSRRIAALEASLGVRLVQRTSRSLAFTVEGERLLARAREPLASLEAALDGVTDRETEPSGRLRVTATLLVGAERIAPALVAFARRHPRVAIELQLTNAIVPMLDEGVDLAFRAGPVTDGDLVARRIATLPYALAGTPDVVAAVLGRRRRATVEMLAEAPAVTTRAGAAWRLVRSSGVVDDVQPHERFVANDPRVAIAAAASGLGLVAAPTSALAAHAKTLVPVPIAGAAIAPRDLYAVFPSRAHLPVRVRAAIDFVAARMAVDEKAHPYGPGKAQAHGSSAPQGPW